MLEIENPAGAAARTARSLRNHVSDDFTMTIRAALVFAILFACQAAHADCSCECINGRMSMLWLFARRLFARSGHRPLHHSQCPGSRLLVQACAGKPGCATQAETVSCRRFVINPGGTRGF
jgi:hypothetical protein